MLAVLLVLGPDSYFSYKKGVNNYMNLNILRKEELVKIVWHIENENYLLTFNLSYVKWLCIPLLSYLFKFGKISL